MVKNPPAMLETWVPTLDLEDLLQTGMATHSSILAWRISWAEELARLQSIGSQRVRHAWSDLARTHIGTNTLIQVKNSNFKLSTRLLEHHSVTFTNNQSRKSHTCSPHPKGNLPLKMLPWKPCSLFLLSISYLFFVGPCSKLFCALNSNILVCLALLCIRHANLGSITT